MIDATCKICGAQDYRSYLRFKDKAREIVVCTNCRTFRTLPYFEPDYSEHGFYCEHYIKNEELFRGFARKFLSVLARHRQKGRFLDIGCSVGFILEEARRLGFQVEGMELNEKAVKIACSKGLNVKRCEINNAGYDGRVFDVVVLNHILEHIIEPGRFIKDVKAVLKDDGLLIIGVPNHDSLIARLYKGSWYGWGIPEHVWHFDKRSLGDLLSKNGLKIKELIQNIQYYPFSKSFRKNLMALVARLGSMLGMGDQLIVVAEKDRA